MPVEAADLIAAARDYVEARVPFRHQGRSRTAGLDCIGLIVCAARDIGIALPDRHDYARDPRGDELEREMDATLIRIAEPEPAAVALIRFRDTKRHVALLTPKRVIHVWDLVGRACEHDYHRWFISRTARLYRIPGVITGQWPVAGDRKKKNLNLGTDKARSAAW
jgi:cell wall-associated NlpC family hydrolase